MNRGTCRILLVDDDQDDYILTRALLNESVEGQFDLEWVNSFTSAWGALEVDHYDAVLVDYNLGSQNGVEFVREAAARGYPGPMILLTGHGSYSIDLQAMEAGAADYLSKKEVTSPLLERAIRYAIERKQTEAALKEASEKLERRVQDRTRELQKAKERLEVINERLEASNQALQAEVRERQRVEERLLERETRLNLFLEQIPAVVWSTDTDLRFTSSLGKSLASLGLLPDQVVGVSLEEFSQTMAYGPATVEAHRRALQGEVVDFEAKAEGFIFEGHVTPLRNAEGEIIGSIGLALDTTERIQAQQALRESEARFRAVFEESALGIALKDLDGLILASNHALQEMLGYSAAELCNKSFVDLTDPADAKAEKALISQLSSGEIERFQLEKRYLHKDGTPVWARLDVTLVRDEQGQPVFTVSMIENIQERKQMEAELAEVRRRLSESREEERMELARDLHDGPMQELYGVVFQLGDMEGDAENENSVPPDWLEKLQEVKEHVLKTVQELRFFSSELRPPTLATFGLEATIRAHAETFQNQHPEIHLQLELEHDEHTLTENLQLALFRIYQQSLANVVRHSGADRVSVYFTILNEQATLEIEDNGRGFVLPSRPIELVRQGHLGLVGATERAEAVGGTLTVISSPGKGTLIRVSAPLSGVREAVPGLPEPD